MGVKLTYEEVKRFIEEESNSGCKLISENYISSDKKLIVQCMCGNIFNPKFSYFKDSKKRQRSCNECRKKESVSRQRLKYEDIKYYIETESQSGCKLMSKKYLNVDSKLEIMCKCGNIFELSFYCFRRNKEKMCDDCKKTKGVFYKSFKYDYIKRYIEIESKSECQLLSKEYLNNASPLSLKCKCGKIFKTTFNSFKGRQKMQCNDCSNKNLSENRLYDFKYVKNYIEENSNCKLMSHKYEGVFKPLDIMCVCGEIFQCSLNAFKHKKHKGCNKCLRVYFSNIQSFSLDEVRHYIEMESDSGCVLLNNSYKNAHSVLDIKCSCGKIFKVSYAEYKYKNKQSCNICSSKNNKYKGEIIIQEFLINNNIDFYSQKTFHGLVGVKKGLLSYDFYLADYNLLIEYQGEFHDGTARQQSELQYIKQQVHDKRKREYAINKNINFLEIWYYDFDKIQEILSSELNINNKIKKIT